MTHSTAVGRTIKDRMVELDEDIESFEYEASYGGTASIDEGVKPSEMEADVAVSALSQVEADCELVN